MIAPFEAEEAAPERFTIEASLPSEADVRRDERLKLAALFHENRGTIQSFLKDSDRAVDLIVFLLRLAPGGQP